MNSQPQNSPEAAETTIVAPEVTMVTPEIKTNVLTFLTFAMYMGYITEFADALDNWINGKAPETYVQSFLKVEAEDILTHMKKDFSDEEMHKWWDDFYPLVLEPVDEMLKNIQKDTTKI